MSWRVINVDTGEPLETYVLLNDKFAECRNCRGVHKWYTRQCKPALFFNPNLDMLSGSSHSTLQTVNLFPTPTSLIEENDFALFDWSDIDVEITDLGDVELCV